MKYARCIFFGISFGYNLVLGIYLKDFIAFKNKRHFKNIYLNSPERFPFWIQ